MTMEGQTDLVTGEVVPADQPQEGEVVVHVPGAGRVGDVGLAEFINTAEAEADKTPEELAYRAIVTQILGSETVRDVLTPIEAINATEELDRPFELEGCAYQRSEYEQGAPFYAVLQVKFTDDGERMVLTTGNQAVMAQVISLQTKHDAAWAAFQEWQAKGSKGKSPDPVFPLPMKLVEVGNPNRFGNRPLRLVTPDWAPKVRKGRATRTG